MLVRIGRTLLGDLHGRDSGLRGRPLRLWLPSCFALLLRHLGVRLNGHVEERRSKDRRSSSTKARGER